MTARVLVSAALAIGACSSASGGQPAPDPGEFRTTSSVVTSPSLSPPSTVTTLHRTTRPVVEEYRPTLKANLFLPDAGNEAPLVVMVPGGGWRTADPSGFAGLARWLSDSGMIALTVEIGAAEHGVTYPDPIEDIHCAVGFGVAAAEQAGVRPGPVVLLGHSSGAHLASLAALTEQDDLPDCPRPAVKADALVGLAGVYDVTRLPALAVLLFGVSPDDDPDVWEEGNPLRRARLRPELPILLLHGDSDPLVPVSFTEDFAVALRDGGHAVETTVVGGADHREILLADVTGRLISDWVNALAG